MKKAYSKPMPAVSAGTTSLLKAQDKPDPGTSKRGYYLKMTANTTITTSPTITMGKAVVKMPPTNINLKPIGMQIYSWKQTKLNFAKK
jgi:hypothetical protein